ncbi:MAG: hypothetical protein ND895_11560 [Pyrinomonadaceae bacterium]|nr:hypothetical protein [Pyrinomonadaceae bacterium]
METSRLNSFNSMTARKSWFRALCPAFLILCIIGAGLPAQAQIEVGRHALGFRFAERDNLPHGVAADALHIFVTEPLNGRVAVLSRITGSEIAEIPAPPGGFLLPFGLRTDGSGKLVILDSGGFPSPTSLAIPRVYVYSYTRTHHGFSATLRRTVTVNVPVIFSEELEVISPGRYVISDSGFGAIWIIEPDGTVAPGITPQTLNPADAIPILAPCFFPPGATVGGIPFRPPGDFAPGVGALGTDGTHLYMSGTCRGGVSRVPLAVFSDGRAPWERAADIEDVFVRPGGEVGTMKGLVFNRYNRNDDSLYALEPFNLRLVRINVETGERTVLLDDPVLFNFPVGATFLPFPGLGEMVITSDQEHRLAVLNAALTGDITTPPFLLTKVFVGPSR